MNNDFLFMMYVMEQEGEIPTHSGKINKFIHLLAQSNDPNDPEIQSECANQADLDPTFLTPEEIEYIEKEVQHFFEWYNNR